MKTKVIITTSILAATAILSCQKIEDKAEYLTANVGHYTFMGKDNDTLKVYIQSNPDWTASSEETWLKYERRNDTLYVTAENNVSGTDRSGNVEITAGSLSKSITVTQLSERQKGIFEDMYYFSHNITMSSNGHYIAGMIMKEIRDDASIFTPVLLNTHTGEKTYLSDMQGWDAVTAISGDGRYIAYQDNSGSRTSLKVDDQEVELQLPEGFKTPRIQYISNDGSIMIGYCKSLTAVDGWKPTLPVMWVNGEPELLDVPSTNIWGDKFTLDVMARGASADCSVIYGSEWTDLGLIYWKDKEVFYTGYEYADKSTNRTVILEAERTNISPSGKYIGCSETELYTGSFAIKTPAVIDTEKNELIKFEESDEGACTHVTNDGTAFIACPSLAASYGFAADVETKTITPVAEWMKQKYGITMSDNRYIRRISEDGKVVFGIQTISTALGPGFIPWYYYTGE